MRNDDYGGKLSILHSFGRRFYPKRLALHFKVHIFTILSVLAFPGNQTHYFGVASANTTQESYFRTVSLEKKKCFTLRAIFRNLMKKSGEAWLSPPSAWMGSITMPATGLPFCLHFTMRSSTWHRKV